MNASTYATDFAAAIQPRFTTELNTRHNLHGTGSWVVTTEVHAGRKYDKVVVRHGIGAPTSGSVHAFIERATGHVFKPATWASPAKGVRFISIDAAVAVADSCGAYLYR